MMGLTHNAGLARLLREKYAGIVRSLVQGGNTHARPTLCRNMEEVFSATKDRCYWGLFVDLTIPIPTDDLVSDVQAWLCTNRGKVAIGVLPPAPDAEMRERAREFEQVGGQVYDRMALHDDETWTEIWTANQFRADKCEMQSALLDECERQGKVLYHEELFLQLLDISAHTSNASEAAAMLFRGKHCKTKAAARQRLYAKIAAANALPPQMILMMFRMLWQAWFIKHNRPIEEMEAFLGYDDATDAFIRHLNRTLKCDISELLAINYDKVLSWVVAQITNEWNKIPSRDALFMTLPGFRRRRLALASCEYGLCTPNCPCEHHAGERQQQSEAQSNRHQYALPLPNNSPVRQRKKRSRRSTPARGSDSARSPHTPQPEPESGNPAMT